jgi:hypothetical protein
MHLFTPLVRVPVLLAVTDTGIARRRSHVSSAQGLRFHKSSVGAWLVSVAALFMTHQQLCAQTLGFYRFETETGVAANSVDGTSFTEYGTVEQVTLTNEGRGAHFPMGLVGIGPNRSAVTTLESVSGYIADETMTVDGAFTVELFANFENLDRSVNRSVMVAQAEFPCCGTWERGFSWSFVVERAGESGFPGRASRPRELEMFLSDGAVIWLIPSGIFLNEDTDYYLSASFDVNAGLRFYVKDLSADETQIVELPHTLNQLNRHSTLGVLWPQNWSQVEGIVDEVRFSRGVLAEDELLINQIADLGDLSFDGQLEVDDVDLLVTEISNARYDRLFDVNRDGQVDPDDLTTWVRDLKGTWFGDANLDGEFSSADFIAVFQAGKFESDENANWSQGDWNGDGVFSSTDFVTAFQDGGYEQGPRTGIAAVPEPSTGILAGLSLLSTLAYRRHRRGAQR